MVGLWSVWRQLMAGLGATSGEGAREQRHGQVGGDASSELRVCVDLTEVLPDDVVFDVVLWPAQWHRRVELIDAVVAVAARRRTMRVEIVSEGGDGWVERWWQVRGSTLTATVEGRIRLRLR